MAYLNQYATPGTSSLGLYSCSHLFMMALSIFSLDQLEDAMAEILQTVDQQSQIRERAVIGKHKLLFAKKKKKNGNNIPS